jgi:TRAP-type mannitol/chloroaromatic compound transport system substrate-binding protein
VTTKYDAVNSPALGRLLAHGVQLRGFSQQIMETCYRAANEVYAEISAQSLSFKEVYDNFIAFPSISYLWWQVAELSFDRFQVRMHTGA